jgi:predicted DNA-binding transcriptional regulator YafY
MKSSQLARQLQLIEMLYSPRGCTIEQLTRELECSRRTIFRDLRAVEAAGVEVLFDHGTSSYCLAPDYGILPPRLFGEELLALALAVSTSAMARAPELATLLEQALGKISAKAPLEQRQQIRRVVEACHIPTPGEGIGRPGLLRKIIMALAVAARLRVVCRTDEGRKIIHDRIIPVSLHWEEGQWAFGYRTSAESETVVVPLSQVIDVQPDEQGVPVFGRHLLSEGRLA